MDMHELEQAWRGLGTQLERQNLVLRQLLQRDGIRSVRARLRLLSLGQLAQLAIGLLIVLWAGGYWFGHLGQTHLVVYGVAIHLYGLGLLIAAILQLVCLARIDHRRPVLEVQQRLLSLRRLRVGSDRILTIAGFLVWVPFVFIVLHAGGSDVWRTLPSVVLANLAVGLGLAGLVAWLMHRFRDTFERDAAGRSLREAEAEIAELLRAP